MKINWSHFQQHRQQINVPAAYFLFVQLSSRVVAPSFRLEKHQSEPRTFAVFDLQDDVGMRKLVVSKKGRDLLHSALVRQSPKLQTALIIVLGDECVKLIVNFSRLGILEVIVLLLRNQKELDIPGAHLFALVSVVRQFG